VAGTRVVVGKGVSGILGIFFKRCVNSICGWIGYDV